MNFIRNIPLDVYNASALAVGYILVADSTPAIQNSLGNWFMLVGQVLCTNAAQQQVLNSNQSNEAIVNHDDQINMMQKAVDAINQQINNLKS